MMQGVIRALTDELSPCGLPLYLADCVPQGQPFPYLTAAAALPLTGNRQGSITLTLWCAGPSANMTRLVLHDALMQYFPRRGLCLMTDDGLAVLRPGTSRCVQQGEALGTETVLDVRFFSHEQGG